MSKDIKSIIKASKLPNKYTILKYFFDRNKIIIPLSGNYKECYVGISFQGISTNAKAESDTKVFAAYVESKYGAFKIMDCLPLFKVFSGVDALCNIGHIHDNGLPLLFADLPEELHSSFGWLAYTNIRKQMLDPISCNLNIWSNDISIVVPVVASSETWCMVIENIKKCGYVAHQPAKKKPESEQLSMHVLFGNMKITWGDIAKLSAGDVLIPDVVHYDESGYGIIEFGSHSHNHNHNHNHNVRIEHSNCRFKLRVL